MDNTGLKKDSAKLFIETSELPHFVEVFSDITDEVFIIDKTKGYKERFYAVFAAFFFIGVSIFSFSGNTKIDAALLILAPFMIILFVTGVVLIINSIINSERKFVFDRSKGTVTIRASILNWQNKTITFPFKDINIYFLGLYIGKLMAIGLPKSKYFFLALLETKDIDDQIKSISFLTWYMDKNRPLPPLEKLDAYREKDYLRRKAEGFPQPLYPSCIPTPDEGWYIPKGE